MIDPGTLAVLVVAWLVNTGLTTMVSDPPPPPPVPLTRVCYVERMIEDERTLIPYECIGGR